VRSASPSAAEIGECRRGAILWLTGLPCSGKTTLAHAIGPRVAVAERPVEILDGDQMRTHLSKGLGFSKEDRDTNVRRIGFVARLLARHGVFVIAAAISPYADTRAEVRRLAEKEGLAFIEVFLDASLQSLIDRDVKGLYRKALAGDVQHFTGVSDPYEPPVHPDIIVRTDVESVAESVQKILGALVARGIVPRG
jgi:adenylyl-sulfate kinase